MVNTRSNPQTARGRRRRLREKTGTTSKATSKYHSGTYSTDPGTAHSHIRTVRAPSIASSSRDAYQENTPPASTRSRGASFVVKAVVQVLNGGKPTFASKLRESVEREAKARRGVEAGRPDFDWEDKVSEDEEEEGGVPAEEGRVEAEGEEKEKEEDVVESTVQTATPTPTPAKVVPATQPVRKVFVATPFEPTPISRGWVKKEVISEPEPPRPYDGPFKHIAANNARRVDEEQSTTADVQDRQEIFEDAIRQLRHQESLFSDSVDDVDNRRGSLHLANEPRKYEYGASVATPGSGSPSFYADQAYYRSMFERGGFAGHSSTATTGYGTRFNGRFAVPSDGSLLGDHTERSIQRPEMSDEEKNEMKEVNDRLYRINHRSDLVHRLETLHLANKSPGLNVMFDQQTREETFDHWDNRGKPLPTLDGTGGWGPHTMKDVTNAGLGNVFDLSITKSPAVTSPFIEGSIRNPAYARKLREVYSGSKSVPKPPPGFLQPRSSLGPLDDRVLDDVASRLSYLHNEQNLHAFAENEPELEYGRCVEDVSPAESFMSAEDLEDPDGAYDYFNDDSPCLRMCGHFGPGTRERWRQLRTQWRSIGTPPKMKPLVSPSSEPHFSPAPISPGMPGFTFRFAKPARQPMASGIVNMPVFHLMEPGLEEWSDSDLNDAPNQDPFGTRFKRPERDGRMAPTPFKGRGYAADELVSPDGCEDVVSPGQMFVEGQWA